MKQWTEQACLQFHHTSPREVACTLINGDQQAQQLYTGTDRGIDFILIV